MPQIVIYLSVLSLGRIVYKFDHPRGREAARLLFSPLTSVVSLEMPQIVICLSVLRLEEFFFLRAFLFRNTTVGRTPLIIILITMNL